MKTPQQTRIGWFVIGASGVAALSIVLAGGPAVAQDLPPKPKSTAQIDAGEPRAATSPSSAAPSDVSSSSGTPSDGAQGPDATAAPGDVAGAKRSSAPASAKKSPAKAPGAADRVDLGTATVTGDREQPKVMYVVPWKSADMGDLSGKPMNSLIDEALAPVDRDEFKREVVYYNVMKTERSRSGAPNAPAAQGEK
jgi:hypothetical protein